MRARRIILISLCLLLAAGAWLLWLHSDGRDGSPSRPHAAVAPAVRPHLASGPAVAQARPFTILSTNNVQAAAAARAKANQFRYRLSNTTRTIGQLVNDRHAILLANALIDTSAKLNLSIPKKLQAPGEPGAYIVQANGPIDNGFRAMLAQSGAQIVSYIPNNAYLVTLSASSANALAADGLQVIPYEPYYKVSASLMPWIGKSLPAAATLNVELFPGKEQPAIQEIEAAGGKVLSQEESQNGWIVNVQPPADWTAVPALPGVHIVEPSYKRAPANDLSRETNGVAVDTQTTTNYMGLTGKNVLVEVNDSGIDATHPDFSAGGSGPIRVIGDLPTSLVDTDGHGTHVAGIIGGDGTESTTVTNAQGSIMPGTTGQFRGMAPAATLFSVGSLGGDADATSDLYLQETPAQTNALISNNSWNYAGDSAYDLEAASYDAAVRDALPLVTGSQPVLFVFAAGNAGNGDDTTDPGNGTADSIESPATAKNVITVGAIQEFRNITNEVTNADGTISAPWQADTSTGYRIAGFSSRGNVGIGTEGTYGRYKPDVVAPGTSIISTRSSQWDIGTYFYQSPTNYNLQAFSVVVQADTLGGGEFPVVPTNTVQVTIQLFPNGDSPEPFPFLPIYFGLASSSAYDYVTFNNQVSIPPDGGLTIPDILNSEAFYGFNFAVSNITSEPIKFDIVLDTITTNYPGNYFLVFSNLDNSLDGNIPPHYYRYETGTSMSAADVSGVLADIQDYFTNTLQTVPSPALLKALLINGARPTGAYDLQVQNNINFEGWGLINLPNSLPSGVTNVPSVNCTSFFIDQNPTNALATGDSHTFTVNVSPSAQQASLPLRVTLAWTDPPGDPAAAIKLVNSLSLVVSNGDSSAGPVLFYGNDIGSGSIYNTPENTNTPAVFDAINNVENVFISPPLGTTYTITVSGRSVNVNAVTAQTNTIISGTPTYAPNVVQDFALVVSCGEGEVTNSISGVTDVGPGLGIFSNPTTDQQISFLGGTNVDAALLNQFVGASTPLLGTNTVPIGTITVLDTNGVPVTNSSFAANAIVTIGMTNQWHFYVITNPPGGAADVTNAAFITFLPDTLSIPRMGVFADSTANATRTEADIDLYVTTDSTLTNLNPAAISNCVHGTQVGVSSSSGGVFNGASLSRVGTEFVVDIGSTPGQVYYVGVYSEDQMASEYDFLSIFTSTPFSQMQNGIQTVNGQLIPVNIPDGSPAHPGIAYIFGLAIYPMEVGQVVVNDAIVHQNFGDLIGTLNHNDIQDVLNNHDSFGNPPGPYTFEYDDSGSGNTLSSQPSDGPGSLQSFAGTEGIGPWMLAEEDTSLTQTGYVSNFSLTITPHQDLKNGITVVVQPGTWFYTYIDVPVGYTNLSVFATNVTLAPDLANPLELFVKLGSHPTAGDTNEFGPALLNNPGPLGPGNSISIGPPLTPGRYFVGIFNPSLSPQTVYIIATLSFSASAISTLDFPSSGPVPILDDAVTTNSIFVTNTDLIQEFSVGLRVDHPRISDLVFHLISPDGTRYLLMENRGGTSTNGCGATIANNLFVPASSSGGPAASTNVINTGETSGTLTINYDFFTIPDEMTVYASTNPADFSLSSPTLVLDTGFISFSGQLSLPYSSPSGYLTIIMNQFGNTNATTAWTYTANLAQTNYLYLSFTEDTNLTTTPIKFAPPPFVPATTSSPVWSDSFETYTPGIYTSPASFGGGWVVLTNQVLITNAPLAYDGTQLLSLMNGAVSTSLPTVAGTKYILSYALGSSTTEGGGPATNVWQLQSYTFTASQTITPLVLNASGNAGYLTAFTGAEVLTFNTNALLDDFTLTEMPGNLNYQPEQDMSALNNTPANGTGYPGDVGTWTLEIQDDRAGATNNATLLSWQLGLTFANTNFIPTLPILGGGQPVTGTVCSNSVIWYQVNVPTNAIAATNSLLLATAPVNVWYSVNNPPTTNNPGDAELMANQTAPPPFAVVLTPTTLPALVPGGTYYLGVQGPSDSCSTYTIEVDFDLVPSIPGPFAFTQPAYAVTGTNAQLNGMATPNVLPATAWFQWGTTTAYGNQTPPVSVGTGPNVVYTESQISGLLPNVPYHFRLVVSNALTVVYGFDQILDEANVVVWGANYAGQANVPAGLSNVVAIAGAYDHSLALKNNETAVGWGDNFYGAAAVPAGLNNLVGVAGGESYSLALQNSETVVAWGSDFYPGAGETNVPGGLNNVVMIASGQYSSLALRSDGTVTAWGASLFNPTNLPAGLANVVSIAEGTLHSLAIKNDGTVVAWGDDGAGQTNVPAGLNNVVAIAAGSFHSLALKYDGTVVAWGYDSAGQTNVPAGLSNVVAVAAGGFHSMALKNDGSVVTWGDNSAGQQNVPGGLTNFVAIAAGFLHSLALTPQSVVNLTNIVSSPTNGVPQTNNILGGSITWYPINVPANADYATNILLFTVNGSLNIWYDTNNPPTTNVFLFSGTNGSYTLSTTGTPPLVPGSTYYLGVQNTNSFTVNYAIEVDFHLVPPTNAPPIIISGIVSTNIGGTNGFLLTWYAPTNDIFMVQWTGSLNPPIAWNTFSNIITYTSLTPTNGIGFFEFFDDGSQTGGVLDPVRFYRLILLTIPTNGVPQTNSVPTGGVDYFLIDVPTNADFATNRLLSATGPVNLLFNQSLPPMGTNTGDYTLLAGMTNGLSILSTTSMPTNIVPGGSYWLGVQNTNSFAVTFSLEVDFQLVTSPTNVPPIIISGIISTNNGGTNGFLLTWYAPTNDIFQVLWTDTLSPANWQFFSNFVAYTGPLTPTNGLFSFLDDGSQTPPGLPPIRFYRIVLAGSLPSTNTNAVFISSITSTNITGTNSFRFTWSAPTNYFFEVQWTTNLVPVVTWRTFPDIIAYSTFVSPTNSLFNFLDDGTQSDLGPIKFYRLIILP